MNNFKTYITNPSELCGVRLVKDIYTTLKSNLTPLKIFKTELINFRV